MNYNVAGFLYLPKSWLTYKWANFKGIVLLSKATTKSLAEVQLLIKTFNLVSQSDKLNNSKRDLIDLFF